MEEYIKDFDGWNAEKKDIHKRDEVLFFNEGEIWWCSLGINVDVEMDGKGDIFKRPVLIIKKINLQSMWIVPLSSTFRDNPFIYPLKTQSSFVSISQIRMISKKRLLRRVEMISIEEFAHIIIRIKYLLTFQNETPLVGGESRSLKA